MFTGRRPRAFQFKCCVGEAILGQAYTWAQHLTVKAAALHRTSQDECIEQIRKVG
jgi:hypothetical protein